MYIRLGGPALSACVSQALCHIPMLGACGFQVLRHIPMLFCVLCVDNEHSVVSLLHTRGKWLAAAACCGLAAHKAYSVESLSGMMLTACWLVRIVACLWVCCLVCFWRVLLLLL